MGLNPRKYEGMVGNILAMDPLPSVSRAFHLMQQLEKQREVTDYVQNVNMEEMSALNVSKMGNQGFQRRDYKNEKMSKKCDHCGREDISKKNASKSMGTQSGSKISGERKVTTDLLGIWERL